MHRHLIGRQHEIGQPGGNGGAGHPVELGAFFILHHDHAAIFLDNAHAASAVAAGAGQDDRDRFFALIFRQGTQEHIYGQLDPLAVILIAQQQFAVEDGEVLLGRDQIDMVRLNGHSVLSPMHQHRGFFGQQFDHQAFVVGREVLDDDKTQATIRRHVTEKGLNRFQTPSRCAYCHIIGRRDNGGQIADSILHPVRVGIVAGFIHVIARLISRCPQVLPVVCTFRTFAFRIFAESVNFVIPAKAGIQFFQWLTGFPLARE